MGVNVQCWIEADITENKHTVWNLVSKSYQGPIKRIMIILHLSVLLSVLYMRQAGRRERVLGYYLLSRSVYILSQVYLMDQVKSLIVYRDMVNRNCVYV